MTEDESPEVRLQRLAKDRYERPLPKRFYKEASVGDENSVLLDGRPLRTPMKAPLRLPNRALAEAVAAEWEAQQGVINPGLMPVTKYANTAIDRAVSELEKVLEEIVSYAGTDLVCYRAERPETLVRLQAQHWDPVITFARDSLAATFTATTGLSHVPQPGESLDAVAAEAGAVDPFRLTILYNLTTLTGSALLSLMLVRGETTAEKVWAAAHVDEDFQSMEWGVDHEALARREARRGDFDGLVRLLELLGN
ncbi:MAG: ATPase [Proteobacteria bacterium]|nr:ATPase [Pseudomonadota bacterium]